MSKTNFQTLKPWMKKAFEFIFHAETHYRSSSDYSKRMAFINFDNSIEVSIYTFMYRNTKPKGLKFYEETELKKAEKYFYKLEMLEKYLQSKKLPISWDKSSINYYHEQRNKLYHDANLSSPDTSELNEIRQIALWVHSTLFEINNIEGLLTDCITELEKEIPQISEEYAKPVISGIDSEQELSLFYAMILGSWNEHSNGDINILNDLKLDFRTWMHDIREIRKSNEELFSFRNSLWVLKNRKEIFSRYSYMFDDSCLDLIAKISLKVLSEKYYWFDSDSKNVKKSSDYSKELRRGISEFLVLLDIHKDELINCSQSKREQTVPYIISELFKDTDWKLWASLNDVLPILAEAAPCEFLFAVENVLKQSPCPFGKFFKRGSYGISWASYMTGLCRALECLAWSENLLPRIILVLAELAMHTPEGFSINPSESIITILLPWYPQTTATVDKRIVSLRALGKNFPDIAWKVLIRLLPQRCQSSRNTQRPIFRNYIPENWEEGVTNADFWKQVQECADMVVDMSKGNLAYISELVCNLDNIPQPAYEKLLTHLLSDEILNLPDKERVTIWETMISLIQKHRNYADEKWALSTQLVDLLEEATKKITPSKPEYLYRRLFNYKYIEFKAKDETGEQYLTRIEEERSDALDKIYEKDKVNAIVMFTENVESPVLIGNTLACIDKFNIDNDLLPSFLETQESYKKEFIAGYIYTRYNKKGIHWVENFDMANWSEEQKYKFFLFLPFEKNTWEKANTVLGNIDNYWKNVKINTFSIKKDNSLIIDNLLKYERYQDVISCIHVCYDEHKAFFDEHRKVFTEQLTKALLGRALSKEPISGIYAHQTARVIALLQEAPDIDESNMFEIECTYLTLLEGDGSIEPKLLEKYLSQKPDFFIKVLQWLDIQNNSDKSKDKLNEQKNNYYLAHKLLNGWKLPPGKIEGATFLVENLKEWMKYVKEKITSQDQYETAMYYLGQVLSFVEADSDGFWINKSVAEIFDERDNDKLRQGFKIRIRNSRGAYVFDPSGSYEKVNATLWKERAEAIEDLGFIHFASSLTDLAHSFGNIRGDTQWT